MNFNCKIEHGYIVNQACRGNFDIANNDIAVWLIERLQSFSDCLDAFKRVLIIEGLSTLLHLLFLDLLRSYTMMNLFNLCLDKSE